MMVGEELDAHIGGFHPDALTSGVPLNVDLDTTPTVIAGNLCRLLVRKLDPAENAAPDKLWRLAHQPGQCHLRSHHPGWCRLRRPRSTHPLVDRRKLRSASRQGAQQPQRNLTN
jgi:hypothetical protein